MKAELIMPIEWLKGKLRKDGYYFRLYKGMQIVQRCPDRSKHVKTEAERANQHRFAKRYAGKQPSHYWDEKEVRLLYFCKDGTDKYKWIRTGDSQILAPVIEFGIEKGNNDFPLVLSEIILGPKFPEAATNAAQIKYFKALQQIEEDGDCPVTISKIKGYR